MILAVDAGNTRVKAALVDSARVTKLFSLSTAEVSNDPRVFSRALNACGSRLERLDGAAVCSVVPGLDRVVGPAIRRATGWSAFFLRHDSNLPFRLRLARPERVGADRLAAAAGAIAPRRAHAIVVDIGTAITVDLIAGGEFRGGLIMAGPGLALRALGSYARRLPEIDATALAGGVPIRFDDTEPAMTLGASTAAVGAVLEGVRVLRRSSRLSPAVFVTGGGACVVRDRLPRGWRQEPHLVAKGLYRLWGLNLQPGKKKP
jgi:type III pantothenate kinase